jgi:RAB6A-GEF complex partner protein 1
MTYWPLSSPSVFAATKQTLPDRVETSDDGALPGAPSQRDEHHDADSESIQSSVAPSEGQEEGNVNNLGSEPKIAQVDSQLHPPQYEPTQPPEDDIAGQIVGIRVTRSGHMFATITQSTLTVWQTKVCLAILAQLLLARADFCCSLPLSWPLCFAPRAH